MTNIDVRKVTVLPRDQWERIRSRLEEKTCDERSAEARIAERQRLHEKSQQIVGNWSNTIQGQRQRKLAARLERQEADELEQQRIDREEAKFQQAKRREAIDKAKTLQYYQTDRVKNFHRAMVLSEVLKERDAQVAMRAQVGDRQAARDAKFSDMNKERYEAQTLQEEQLKKKHLEQTLEVANYQKQQRKVKSDVIKREILEDIDAGREYRKADEEYQVWLKNKQQQERKEKTEINREIINQISQKKRLQMFDAAQSKAEDEEIRLFDLAKNELAKARKQREREIKAEKQAISERILDKLVATQADFTQAENAIIERALKERDEAELRRVTAKENSVKMALEDIKQHRAAETDRHLEEKRFARKKDEEDLKNRVTIDNEYLASEKKKWGNKRQTAQGFQNFLQDQINQRATKERIAIDNELSCDAKEKEARAREEHEFHKYASDVISRAKARGVNTFPLIKAAQPGDGGGHGPVDAVGTRPSFLSTDGYGVQLPTYQKGSTEAVRKYYSPTDMEHAKKRFGFVW